MQKLYDEIMFSTDSLDKKKRIHNLGSYGKKAIPRIQELSDIETDEDVKNYMFDTITQINKGRL